jgi:hypothetical protein
MDSVKRLAAPAGTERRRTTRKTLTDPSPRLAALGAAVAAVASAVGAVIQVTHEQSSESTVVGTAEHIGLAMFSLMLLAMIPPVIHLARRATGTVRPGVIMAVAAVALAALATVSNVDGEDASFFAAVAVPTNLAIFGSLVAIAVIGNRRGFDPRWLVIGLPLVQILGLPLSQVGGGLIAAGYWVAFAAWALRSEGRAPRIAARPVTA